MTQHSPTPWSIDHDDPTLIHENSDGRWRPVAEVFGNGLPNAQANAAFIVDSVNSHARLTEQRDELLAALRNSTSKLVEYIPKEARGYAEGCFRYVAGGADVWNCDCAICRARAAIAKCEVTQ
jgi:hypothetical protein